ncbi:hypothetical protein LPJ61_004841 [Coemansia biformis]|uniref:Uncharacterized protein n=1 Tax=Coemansia biformis TaxID=1286918 RepID=A0A9W7Y9G7_9FUNG|nr:hypothetical protein LPJ61_004841 [Coemansia biformis]
MSSLSYNWQNEFVDLRYQVDDLQRNDPDQYNQLATAMGLKPGAKISIPSEYSPEWASRFVAAAHLYTPAAATEEATQAPTPTNVDNSAASSTHESIHLVTAHSSEASDSPDDGSLSDEEDGSSSGGRSSSRGSSSSKHASKSTSRSDASGANDSGSEPDNGIDQASDDASVQFGNPVVGNMSNGPVVPTGQGYSAAATLHPRGIPAPGAALLALWLLLLAA